MQTVTQSRSPASRHRDVVAEKTFVFRADCADIELSAHGCSCQTGNDVPLPAITMAHGRRGRNTTASSHLPKHSPRAEVLSVLLHHHRNFGESGGEPLARHQPVATDHRLAPRHLVPAGA